MKIFSVAAIIIWSLLLSGCASTVPQQTASTDYLDDEFQPIQ